jgi:hypothetical protein
LQEKANKKSLSQTLTKEVQKLGKSKYDTAFTELFRIEKLSGLHTVSVVLKVDNNLS